MGGIHKVRSVKIEQQLEFERKILSREGIEALTQSLEREGEEITVNTSNAKIWIQNGDSEAWA